MSDVRPAEFVRQVDPEEDLWELVNEAKAATWTHRREHALLVLDEGRRVLVRGGADGVTFVFREPDDAVMIDVGGQPCRVRKLAWHAYPEPTGPSDHDVAFLAALLQHDSLIFELRGAAHGVRFTSEKRRE